jgi:general secretion pathway protein L
VICDAGPTLLQRRRWQAFLKFRQALERCMLAELGVWWIDRMVELARPGRGAVLADTLLLHDEAEQVAVTRRRGGKLKRLGSFEFPRDAAKFSALRKRDETLTMESEARVLRRSLSLPLAAEHGLTTLLHYEMDRLTPFGTDEVIWEGHVLSRNRRQNLIEAELYVLPRAAVAAPLQALADKGVVPDCIEAKLRDGTVVCLPLGEPNQADINRTRHRLLAAAAVCVALSVGCIITPFLRQSLAMQGVDAELATLKPQVSEAQALQRKAADPTEADALAAGRHRAADVLAALAVLTNVLPDDTALTQFAIRQRHVTMEGQTLGAATKLIGLLAAEPSLRNTAFSAPVVRGDAGNEIFALQTDLQR